MTKVVYPIYMTVKKSTFYITGYNVTLRSDHLPLNKFLKQMTLNNTVNNWSNIFPIYHEDFKDFVY